MAASKKSSARNAALTKKVVRKPAKAPVAKAAAKRAPAKRVSSRPGKAAPSQAVRRKFLAKIVVLAAALVAVSIGLMTYRTDNRLSVSVAPGQGVMFLQKSKADTTADGSLTVNLYEASGSEPINALQGAVMYPADRLQVVSVTTGQAFPQEAATDTATPGLIRLARSVRPQAAPVSGTRQIAVIQFKVLKTASQPLQLTVDTDRSLLVRSTDNQNILTNSVKPQLDIK